MSDTEKKSFEEGGALGEPARQNPDAVQPAPEDTLATPTDATYEDGSPKKAIAVVAGLPTDVTQVQDQLVHTNQDTGAKTLIGRIRDGFVELTKWGESFFESKPKLEVTSVEGVTVNQEIGDSTEPLQNDGLPSTSDKALSLGVTGHAIDGNSHNLANDGLPATYKRQPEVLSAGNTFDPTVDAQVKPVPEAPPGTMPSTGMLEGSATPGAPNGQPTASPDAAVTLAGAPQPAAVSEPSQAPTPVVQGSSADQSVATNNRNAQTSP